jgi:hypothetical protein
VNDFVSAARAPEALDGTADSEGVH